MNVDTNNPYVGLRPFDVDESILFFGRNEQALELLESLHKYHFVAVVGSSGSGKSSLLRAGLIPSLKAGYLVNDRDHWFIAIMKPGQSPLYNFAEAILLQLNPAITGNEITQFLQKIKEEGIDAVLAMIEPLWKENNINFFLLVDQFEELFRFAMEQKNMEKKDEAIDFVNIILELSQQQQVPFYVVITMRSDFIGDCTQFYGLPEAMNKSQYLVPRITRSQLKTVIEGPAKLYGNKIDPLLTSKLINELNKIKDELPLLQHALMRMWDEMLAEKKHILELDDYKDIGGIEEALSNHADEALIGISDDELILTKKIFQALTAIDEGGRKIRRPVLLSQLITLTGASEQDILKIINFYIEDKRSFLVINEAHDGVDSVIDISHESLIRQWKKLSKWVEEEGDSAANYLQLAQATKLFKQKRKDLLNGSELKNTLEWYNNFKPMPIWANRYKAGFEESEEYLKRSEAAEIAMHDAERRSKKKEKLFIIAIMVLITVVAIVSVVTLISTRKQKAITANQYDAFLLHAKAQEKIDEDPTIALRLEEAAFTKMDTTIIEQGLVKTYRENSFYKICANHSAGIYSVAFSPDGKTILTGAGDSSAILWDLKGNKLITLQHANIVNAAIFSPDGKTILTACKDKAAILWDFKGNKLQVFKGHTAEINAIAFSPDGKSILTGSSDSLACLWDLKGNKTKEFKKSSEEIYAVAFSPNGKTIITGSRDGIAQIIDIKGNMHTSYNCNSSINAVVFSPDGNTIAIGCADKTAKLYDFKSNRLLRELKGHDGRIYAVAFSGDGQRILTGSDDKTARLWDLKGNVIQILKGHTYDVNAVAFSPDGTKLLTGSEDRTARLWSVKEIKLAEFSIPSGAKTYLVAVSNDGKKILTGSNDQIVRIWDSHGKILKELNGCESSITAIAFSPDGEKAIAGSFNGKVYVWDTAGKPLQNFTAGNASINAIAFSHYGDTILTGSANATACLWNVKGKKLLSLKRNSSKIVFVNFSPDGKQVLATALDSTAVLWTSNGKAGLVINDSLGLIIEAVFSPDGKCFLTGSSNKTVKLWNLKGEVIMDFKGHNASVNSVSFSQDGKKIITGSYDKTVRIWNLQGTTLQELKGDFFPVSFVTFFPDEMSYITCSLDGVVRIWKTPDSLKSFLASGNIEALSNNQY